jgi:hypothetical protein
MRTVVELARDCTVEAIETLRLIALDPKAQAMARVRACESLLQRGWGVPMRESNVDALMDDDPGEISFRLVLGPELKPVSLSEEA